MTTELTRVEVNCETGETQIVPLTQEEILQMEKDALELKQRREEEQAARASEEAAKASAAEKLAAIGLTADELKAILG